MGDGGMKTWSCVNCGKELHEGDSAWQSPVTHHITSESVRSTVDYQCEDCFLLRLKPRVLHMLADGHKGYVRAVTTVREEMGWTLRESGDWVKATKAEALS